MTDREIFRKNLNDFLSSSGKLQKDLADYVGAKTTTVSGWTRGISYPRADSMEKIAMFFGVPTSRLVGDSFSEENQPISEYPEQPKNENIRLLINGLNKLSPEQIAQATEMMKIMFAQYADYFEKEDNQ